MRRYQSCSMTTGSSNHYHISTIPTDGKMMFGMILIASFVLKRSEAFIDSTRADGPSISYSSCATASSTFNSPDESAFWGRERTQEEICQFVTDAVLSVESKLETPRVEVLSAEPPLIVVHNFVSPSDCHAIITATQQHQEMKRSTMGASQETSQERTSSTAWLPESLCEQPLGRLSEKASRISQLPTSYMENLQVVKYQPGQEFQIHTDHLDSFNDLECRGRLATCLVYLESPDEAGETSFPEFSVEIPPTQGSAVFFLEHNRASRNGELRSSHVSSRRHEVTPRGAPSCKGHQMDCQQVVTSYRLWSRSTRNFYQTYCHCIMMVN
jgi:prolyl 4-hydroxylase